jgi:hypothetical protein
MMVHRRLEHCAEDLVAVEWPAAGQAFHRIVQSAFLTGLAGRRDSGNVRGGFRGGQGRVDLAVEVDGASR